MAKSKKYSLRWARNRFKKGKATSEDLELIREMEPELLEVERDLKEVGADPEPKKQNTGNFKDVGNSQNYSKPGSASFMEDVNEFTEYEEPKFEGFSYEQIDEDQNQQAEQQKEDTKYMNGAMLLFLIDLICPEIFAFIAKKLFKKNVKASDLKSYEELKSLEEIADKVADEIQTDNLSPVNMLILGCAFIYVPKIMMSE